MWTFKQTVKIEKSYDQWCALVTLDNKGVAESFYLTFPTEPSNKEVDMAGVAFALNRNIQAGTVLADTIPREDFFARFTNKELAAIYKAIPQNDDLFGYFKKIEFSPAIVRKGANVIAALALLETLKILVPGRAAEILGA